MRTVLQIIDEINAASIAMKKRNSKDGADSLANKMAAQVARAIGNLENFETKDAELLYAAIDASALRSPALVVSAIDARLELALDQREDDENAGRSQKTQHLLAPEAWMHEELYQLAISDVKSFDAKMRGCADYLVRCGIHNPSEKTIGSWLSALVCLHFSTLPQYDKLYNYVVDLKAMVVNSRRSAKFSTVWNYPKSPELLPDATFTAIFGDDLRPQPVTIPKFSEVYTNHMPLRSTSNLLKKAKKGEVVKFVLSPPCQPKCKTDTTPLKRSSSNFVAAKIEPSSGVKSEPDNSLKSEPDGYDTKDMPDWASELITALSGKDVPGPVPSDIQPSIKNAMSALTDGPAWARELHALLEFHCDQAVKPAMTSEMDKRASADMEEPVSAKNRLKAKLCPRGNLTLRLPQKSEKADNAAKAHLSGDTGGDEGRLSTSAYEEAASAALKSVAARRAEEAKQRKKEKDEEKKKAGAAQSDATPATQCANAEPEVKQEHKRRRLTGKTRVAQAEAHGELTPAHEPKSKARPRAQPKANPKAKQRVIKLKRPAAVYTIDAPPSCPADDDKTPIEYSGGKIYNTPASFRVLRDKSDAYTEKSFSKKKWGLQEGFSAGLASIEEYWRKIAATLPAGEDVS